MLTYADAQMGHYITYCKLRRPHPTNPAAAAACSRVTPSMFAATAKESKEEEGNLKKNEKEKTKQEEEEEEEEEEWGWYCFDDDLVYAVPKEEAVEGNFGSGDEGGEGGGVTASMFGLGGAVSRSTIERMKKSGSAYMLAYVRYACIHSSRCVANLRKT